MLSFVPASAAALDTGDTPTSNALTIALRDLGLERRDLRTDPIIWTAVQSRRPMPSVLQAFLADPLKAGYRAGTLERRFAERLDSPSRLFIYTASLADADIARGYIGNPLRLLDADLAESVDPLQAALTRVAEVAGAPDLPAAAVPDWSALPNPWRFELARLIMVAAEAERRRAEAFEKFEHPYARHEFAGWPEAPEGDEPQDWRRTVHDVELEAILAAQMDLNMAVEDFADLVRSAPAQPAESWTFDSPLGAIRFAAGEQTDRYAGPPPFVLIDLAGDDQYFITTENKPHPGVSILYDASGNDVYASAADASAPPMSCSVLWDVSGNDIYGAARADQLPEWLREQRSRAGAGQSGFPAASALFGAALHVDEAGDDQYYCVSHGQAFALGGAALLLDLAGDDTYAALTHSQGSAGPRGAAVLLDAAGDDAYTLAATPLADPSAQLPDRNVSMGQGTGYGIRADLSDGRSLAGGVGALLDLAGNDRYDAQVFAQGAGFHEGVGILVENGGDDSYSAAWYGQAAAAHRAGGVLLDRAGNDSYAASHYTSISAAHDGSITFLQDESGDDTYSVLNLGIGGAQDSGTAVFADGAGNDRYELKERAGHGLGSSQITHYGTSREESATTALFFDLGGTDEYAIRREGPADGTRWRGAARYPEYQLPAERGIGIDGEYMLPLRTTVRTPRSDADDKLLQESLQARRTYRQHDSYLKAAPEGGKARQVSPAE